MHGFLSYHESDVTPHIESSAKVDEHGEVIDESITLFPFGSYEARIRAGNYENANPLTVHLSLEEAEVLARLLTGAVTDARNGKYDTIDRE